MKGSGVSRLKQHIAGGFSNVEKCEKCAVEVSRAMREHLDSQKTESEKVTIERVALRETLMESTQKRHGIDVDSFDCDEYVDLDKEMTPLERRQLHIAKQRSIHDLHEFEQGRARYEGGDTSKGAFSSRSDKMMGMTETF
ncbi:unnamed protein product [Ilex paraguariensis]|uniref:Uncharacterized protein n=1 Tax=Ilex paraguariensis TaxID=185542 RepID=A0ABC8UMA4_9AQUA